MAGNVQNRNGYIGFAFEIPTSTGAIAIGDLPPVIMIPEHPFYGSNAIADLIVEGDSGLPSGTLVDIGIYASLDGRSVVPISSVLFWNGLAATNSTRVYWDRGGQYFAQPLYTVMQGLYIDFPSEFTKTIETITENSPLYIGMQYSTTADVTSPGWVRIRMNHIENQRYQPIQPTST
jgi:hypothetical protein